mgnify:CR=1 FL=1
MLTEERFAIILETVQQKRSVRVTELCALLNASVSTVRRDINTLAEMGKLVKVHGGAIALNEGSFFAVEKDVAEKAQLFTEEKEAIARYAASLVDEDDFVYIDAGTTTEKMIDYLPQKRVMFVTNGFIHARKLAQRGFRVYIPGGELKLSTEAIIGTECILTLNNYAVTVNFNVFCIRDNWNIKMFRNLWSNLSCITIDSLFTSKDEVKFAFFLFDRLDS